MSLDSRILDEARALGINTSRAAENGILAAIRTARAEAWKAENAAAIAEFNDLVARDGVPLSGYRKF